MTEATLHTTNVPIAVAGTAVTYRYFGVFRFLLALMVAANHGAWLGGDWGLSERIYDARIGSSAVLTFFVLSGFILSEAVSGFYWRRPLPFVANRLLKIMPAFLGALALSMAVHFVVSRLGLMDKALAFEGLSGAANYMWNWRNLVYNPASIVPFATPEQAWPIVGNVYLFVRYIWAVNVEMLFYACLGMFCLVVALVRSPPKSGWALHAAIACYLALYAFLLGSDATGYYFHYSIFFVTGVLLFALKNVRVLLVWTVTSALLAIVASYQLIGATSFNTGILVFVGLLLAVPLLAEQRLRYSPKVDRLLGDLSYALYLNHFSVLIVIGAFLPADIESPWLLLAYLLAATAVSVAMHRVIERPMVTLRARLRGARLGD